MKSEVIYYKITHISVLHLYKFTMNSLINLICADFSNHLGRLDYDSLSQQTLMEMLVDGITNRETIWDGTKESPKDISEWEGVELDENGNVTEIHWEQLSLEGSMALEWLPPTAQSVFMGLTSITGTVDLTKLPSSMILLHICGNELSGTIDVRLLPDTMISIFIHECFFNGTLDFEGLPKSLIIFMASKNEFTGTIQLSQLPSELKVFGVGENKLSGTVDLKRLPDSLEIFDLSYNTLYGTIDLGSLPATMKQLRLNENRFEGETDLSKLPKSLEVFDVEGNAMLSGVLTCGGTEECFYVENTRIKVIFKEKRK